MNTNPNATRPYKITVMRRETGGYVPSLINPAWTAGMTGPRKGYFGCIELEVEDILVQVSRLYGEDGWTVDGLWSKGCPVFSNGFGSRCTILKPVNPSFVEALDRAMTSVGDSDKVAVLEGEAKVAA